MSDILHDIVAHKRLEMEVLRSDKPSLRQVLLVSDTGIIAEFKRKSPSKGWIKESGRADEIPLAYQEAGAAAVSILTDCHYFGGCDDFIRTARKSGVTLPILYKNFVVDELQLMQAVLCGASAVLLIAACLTRQECRELIRKAHDLGLEVLLEMHAEEELDYAELEPDLYGINNRNLGSFVTDVENSFRLVELLPKDVVKVSESGISNPAVVKELRAAGYRGFLIGENFMRADSPGDSLRQFIAQL
jgi:indole-3-glycerol phosphate synthase